MVPQKRDEPVVLSLKTLGCPLDHCGDSPLLGFPRRREASAQHTMVSLILPLLQLESSICSFWVLTQARRSSHIVP